MRALTLFQPWAQLIADGQKTFETRSWSTSYRGPIAIHAGRTIDREHAIDCGYQPDALPRGAIVAVADLVGMVHTEEAERLFRDTMPAAMAARELSHGDYGPGRWAWELRDVRSVPSLPIGGQRGLWDVPDAVVIELNILTGRAGR